ncbi:APC family permease [Bacillus sonorensis]|uniref:Amino acid transporter n=1 Tax=Bacillus sonorensis L12 TaxID=1274524 RepID=M5P8D3_9BACI|nr:MULTISPECIES: APC family permease [Bacillus]TWK82308.1 Putrescine importer PuuP [Bacillus paralicheniformis]EME76256.1 amino acid transporter [Bacillus sonorensis L12]MCZ0072243.1 APC family permease [Bacillus sonorensis]MCZ0090863.1 APC family permease [Bacillus sonorensis]MEC0338721.1 APC family permease [Bacillus sonorensis]
MKNETALKRSLTLVPLVVIGLAYMDPLVVFDSYGVVAQMTKGHVPAAYMFTVAALLLTALSYGSMVKAYPKAGSAYTYAFESIHPRAGFIAGWTIMLDYLFLPMVNFAISSAYLTAAFPKIPHSFWVILLALSITFVNILGIKLTANITSLFVAFQVIVALTFTGFMITGLANGLGSGELVSAAPFYQPDMEPSLIVSGATILCFSFLGFDAISTMSEETIHPKRNIPLAIFLTVAIGGVLFTAVSYFMQQIYPNYESFRHADSALLEIAFYAGGAFLRSFFLAGTMVAVISSSLSSHASASRLLYAMGRDSSLPKRFFGYVHPRLKTPVFNIILIGLISLTAMIGELEVIYSFISFGALVGFIFVHLSVIAHYYIRRRQKGVLNTVRYLILPFFGAAFLLLLSISKNALIIGAVWLIAGFLYFWFRVRTLPDTTFGFDRDYR